MQVLIIGLGSIARRHAAILARLVGPDLHVTGVDPDFRPEFWGEVASPPDRLFSDLSELLDDSFDLAIVATPSSMHLDHLAQALERAAQVFGEKPLCIESPDEAEERIAPADRERISVGANWRFHPLADTAREWLAAYPASNSIARCESSSWLPDWHPWADYRTEYSVRRDLGGGVAFDSIHELDLALHLFGAPTQLEACAGSSGVLETDTEDWARWAWKATSGVTVLIDLSYSRAQARRTLHVQQRSRALEVDWLAGRTLAYERKDGRFEEQVLEAGDPEILTTNMYERQWLGVLGRETGLRELVAGWDEGIASTVVAREAAAFTATGTP